MSCIEGLAVGVGLVAIPLLVEVVSVGTFCAFSSSEIHLIAVRNGGCDSANKTRSIYDLESCETGKTVAIGIVECLAAWVNFLAFSIGIEKVIERALDAKVAFEGVAIGIEAAADKPRKASIFDESKSRVAAETSTVGCIVSVAVGVDRLANVV